jgi:hypothetical protein
MNIFFWENLVLLIVIFGPWPAAGKMRLTRLTQRVA